MGGGKKGEPTKEIKKLSTGHGQGGKGIIVLEFQQDKRANNQEVRRAHGYKKYRYHVQYFSPFLEANTLRVPQCEFIQILLPSIFVVVV